MKYLKKYKLFESLSEKYVVIDNKVWNNGYSMGMNKLTLSFDTDYQPSEDFFKYIDTIYFSGLYDKLDGDFELVYYKANGIMFLGTKDILDENKIKYEFYYSDSNPLTKAEFEKFIN